MLLPNAFVALVRTILKSYNLDFNRDYLYLRLDKDDSDEILVIEKLDSYLAAISSHKIEQELEVPLISLEFLMESCPVKGSFWGENSS